MANKRSLHCGLVLIIAFYFSLHPLTFRTVNGLQFKLYVIMNTVRKLSKCDNPIYVTGSAYNLKYTRIPSAYESICKR